jgi:hypothetical protein
VRYLAGVSAFPSPEHPLTGACVCGAVRIEVTAPFETAGYCHCTRCQRRTGTGSSLQGRVAANSFAIVKGADAVQTWKPPNGAWKSFCGRCGGHLYSGNPELSDSVGVRFGILDEDPAVRAEWHMWTSSAPPWDPVPDDGLPRYEGPPPD